MYREFCVSFVSFDISPHYQDNSSNCVNDNIAKVLEVYDEETCLETMRGGVDYDDQSDSGSLLIISGYYETAFDKKLPDECRCSLSGCEFDYSSNTYRLQVYYIQISDIR